MHRSIFALLAFMFAFGVRADPAADLEGAIRALLAQPNFRWRVTWEWETAGPNGRTSSFDGVTQRGGYTVVRTGHEDFLPVPGTGERPVQIVYLGERCVLQVEEAWLTPHELSLSRPSATAGMSGIQRQATAAAQAAQAAGARVISWETAGFVYVPRPDLILATLLGQFEQAKETRRAIDAELSERGVGKLFDEKLAIPMFDGGRAGFAGPGTTSRSTAGSGSSKPTRSVPIIGTSAEPRPLPPPRIPQTSMVKYRGSNGSGTFWIVDGMVAKFELELEAISTRTARGDPGAAEPVKVGIKAILNDPGATTVDVPPGARARLER